MPESNGLRVESATVRYGGVTAVDGVTLDVPRGAIVGLIGPNGAGKTSFIDAITGFARAQGEVWLDGSRIDRLRPHQRRAEGLARTWQAGELFGTLSVAENVLASTRPPGLSTIWSDLFARRASWEQAAAAPLELVGLSWAARHRPGELTLGQQKLVGVARALAGSCSTLLLDEPAAGLDTTESALFAERLRRIAASGPGVLLIDHDMELVLGVCDRVYVLEFGRLIFAGTPQEMRADARVVAAYLGSPIEMEA